MRTLVDDLYASGIHTIVDFHQENTTISILILSTHLKSNANLE